MKKCFIFILLASIISCQNVFADYNPLSEEPIESVEQFYSELEGQSDESTEFEYTVDQAPPPENVKPTKNYPEIYNNLQPAAHSYLHNIVLKLQFDQNNCVLIVALNV